MTDRPKPTIWTRRDAIAALAASALLTQAARAQPTSSPQTAPRAFVYTELQISVTFEDAPWVEVSDAIRRQPGFLNKTWLSGLGTGSLGGFYAFDSLENAERFATGHFPAEAQSFGVAHTTRIFDAAVVSKASLDLASPHFGARPAKKPTAFVYAEMQVDIPFAEAPWRDRNVSLRETPGLIAKTWLSGARTHTLGGMGAFDTLENAKAFAFEAYPAAASRMNAAFQTRIFDARITEAASRYLDSPYYA